MPDHFQTLLTAILDNDVSKTKALLKKSPHLAVDAVAAKDQLEPGIVHWIYKGDAALHAAAAGHRVEIAKLLLAAGADPNSAGNRRGSRPLHYAADGYLDSPFWNAKRQVAMLRLLLEAGADLHAQDGNGATALHRAVRTRCAAAVRCLLDAGSDATILNKPGSTAFHLAVQNTGRGGSGAEKARAAQLQIVQTFLQKGVSPDLKDSSGKSVLQWARSDSIRQMLQSHSV